MERAYELDPEMESKLRSLQLGQDVIRTLNRRRLAGARDVREIGPEPVRGRVAKSGCHDELGSQPYVVVRDAAGVEHYGRLGLGRTPPKVGREIVLGLGDRGAAEVLMRSAMPLELSR